MDHHKTPILDALVEYEKKNTVRFHVPGHKGKGPDGPLAPIYPFDVTELPGLDDLHQAEDVIREAQVLAADAFGADETFFLVGGSTAGNMTMLLAACEPGEEILVQRNVHKSVINGLILARAKPIYLTPQVDGRTGLALGVALKELEQMLDAHPGAKAVFLSNPNYFGMGNDLTPYARLCAQAGVPLLVDEAHGAHFGFAKGYPLSAIQAGADAAVQSTHKMLGSMTMSSMLHVKGDRLDRGKLRRALAMLQSSSPSYPLLASLDLARRHLMTAGKRQLEEALALSGELVRRIERLEIPWLEVVSQSEQCSYIDPLKVTLRSRTPAFTGFSLKEYLERHGIYPELADQHHVLLVLSMHSSPRDIQRTIQALEGIPKTVGKMAADFPPTPSVLYSKEVVLAPYEVFHRTVETIPFDEAAGTICGEMIVPYPPGVSVMNPGERVDEETMRYIKELKDMGCRFHGASDPTLQTIQVIKMEDWNR